MNLKMEKIYIVIPAFNEETSLPNVIESLKSLGYHVHNMIVVDDGSCDKTYEIAVKKGVITFRHAINRGLGASLATGIKAAIDEGAKVIVTFDADGQHDVNDIKKLVTPILANKADVVIGSRLIKPKGMPYIRRVGNYGLNLITYLLFGIWTTDSQSGLRAFSRKAAKTIRIVSNRMEVSSEIIREIGFKKLRLKEVPIRVIYTEYSVKHGQSSINGLKILSKLILRRLIR